MVSISSLGVPIVLSAVIVFVASAIMHMVFKYHRSDYRQLPKEDDVVESLRRAGVQPGDYMAPYGGSPAAMKDPTFIAKMTKGPLVIMTVSAGAPPSMGKNLALWFLYSAVISLFAGYLTSRAVGPGTDYLQVFRFVGTSAFMGYSLGLAQFSIWYRRNWGTTIKSMFDGLVYALLTAGTFGWLWPR